MLLYLGIIDILQSYRLKKKLEHSLKAFITDGVRKERGERRTDRTEGRGGKGEERENDVVAMCPTGFFSEPLPTFYLETLKSS